MLLLLPSIPTAHASSSSLTIYNASDKYTYHGCYNETTDIANSTGGRALAGGASETRPGQMTVPLCLAFCSSNGTEYRFAGLEWSQYVFLSAGDFYP